MGEWVILQHPAMLILYGVSFFFCLFDRAYKATKGIFTVVSAFLAIVATAYGLILGAGLWESAALLTVFLLLEMGVRE